MSNLTALVNHNRKPFIISDHLEYHSSGNVKKDTQLQFLMIHRLMAEIYTTTLTLQFLHFCGFTKQQE